MVVGSEAYFFEVDSGAYAGVRHHLGPGRYVVGEDSEADLAFIGQDLAPYHGAVTLGPQGVRVECHGGPVEIDGVGSVAPMTAVTVPLPAVIAFGAMRTLWRTESGAGTDPSSAIARMGAALRVQMVRPYLPGILAAIVMMATVLLTLIQPGRLIAARMALRTDPADAASTRTRPERPPGVARAGTPSAASLRSAAAVLAGEVEQAGLLNVRVQADSGMVSATGTIEPAMVARWLALQQEFDERFAGEITLVNSVAAKAEPLPVALGIEAVWHGASPYVMLRGRRYYPGTPVDGGWTIRTIEQDRVMVERDGRLVAMRF